jgi:hypothetical protein
MRFSKKTEATASMPVNPSKKSLRGRLLRSSLVIALLTGVLPFVFSAPSYASAYGCTGYGHLIGWAGKTVRNGTWCGSVVGNGTYVNYVGGNFYTHIPLDDVCNFSERSEFYDSSGHYYGYVQTATYNRCSYVTDLPNIGLNRTMKKGYVLMKLISNGATVATVEESIL